MGEQLFALHYGGVVEPNPPHRVQSWNHNNPGEQAPNRFEGDRTQMYRYFDLSSPGRIRFDTEASAFDISFILAPVGENGIAHAQHIVLSTNGIWNFDDVAVGRWVAWTRKSGNVGYYKIFAQNGAVFSTPQNETIDGPSTLSPLAADEPQATKELTSSFGDASRPRPTLGVVIPRRGAKA